MPSGQFVTLTWHVPGTLGADLAIKQTMGFDAQLVHVSAVGSNAYAAGLSIGTASDATAHLAKSSIGVSGTPVEFDYDNFATYSSKAYPRLSKGAVLALALDYNYNNGGSAQASADVTITATLMVG
jgi:hypothetical protein